MSTKLGLIREAPAGAGRRTAASTRWCSAAPPAKQLRNLVAAPARAPTAHRQQTWGTGLGHRPACVSVAVPGCPCVVLTAKVLSKFIVVSQRDHPGIPAGSRQSSGWEGSAGRAAHAEQEGAPARRRRAWTGGSGELQRALPALGGSHAVYDCGAHGVVSLQPPPARKHASRE